LRINRKKWPHPGDRRFVELGFRSRSMSHASADAIEAEAIGLIV